MEMRYKTCAAGNKPDYDQVIFSNGAIITIPTKNNTAPIVTIN